MKRVLGRPFPWLLLLSGLLYLGLLKAGELQPRKVPDTAGYVATAQADSWTEALSSYRTLGYPLFLRLFGKAGESLRWLPHLHLLVYLAGACSLFWALRRFGGRPWLAFAGAAALLVSPVLTLVARIQSDMLAAGLALGTIALLMAFSVSPANRLLAVALGGCLFLTYQVRPAYLFLVVQVPVLGPVLRCGGEEEATPAGGTAAAPSPWRWSVGLAALALLPFLLFSGLRGAVVGHFGLVSFGNFNLIGLAASMLDEELVRELPAGQRELGREFLEQRNKRGLKPLRPGLPSRKWYSQYKINSWQIAIPTVEAKVGGRDEAAREINDRLGELCSSILRRRPLLYAKWIVDSFFYGLAGTIELLPVALPGLALLLALPLLLLPAAAGEAPAWRLLVCFAFAAVLYLAGSLGLIALLEVPYGRYLVAVGLLVPSALAMALFELLRITTLRLRRLARLRSAAAAP